MHPFPRYTYPGVYPQKPESNKFWDHWGPFGKIFGIPLIIFGWCLSILEVFRIMYGPLQRGMSTFARKN